MTNYTTKMREEQNLTNTITTLFTRFNKVFIKKTLKMFSFAVLLVSIIVIVEEQARANVFTYQLGQEDNFNQADGLEQATYMSPDEQNWFYTMFDNMYGVSDQCNASIYWQQRCQLRKFDEAIYNRNFHHSFDLSNALQSGDIISATFESKFKVHGSFKSKFNVHGYNDRMWFGHIASGETYSSNVLSFFNGKSNRKSTSLHQTIDANLSLDGMTTSNGSNLLSIMNQEQTLAFHIEDDTMVDYIRLTVETKSTDNKSIPEPSLLLGIVSTFAITILSRKKRR